MSMPLALNAQDAQQSENSHIQPLNTKANSYPDNNRHLPDLDELRMEEISKRTSNLEISSESIINEHIASFIKLPEFKVK